MPDNIHQTINQCDPYEYTLWLRHSPDYNYINAYNLAYLSRLAYSDVFLPDEKTGKKPNGQPIDRDFADFIQKSHQVIRCMGWLTDAYRPVKLSTIKTVSDKISGQLTPFVEIVPEGKGINRNLQKGTGYVHEKVSALTEINRYPQVAHLRIPLTVDALFYTDSKRAVISVRGTEELFSDLMGSDLGAKQIDSPHGLVGSVHEGFHEHFDKIITNRQFRVFLTILREQEKQLFVTGHSLGGAVATLLSAYFFEQGLKPLLYTFGSPRVGNSDFVSAYSGKFPHFRHVNDGDPIPLLPGRWVDGGKADAAKGAAQSVAQSAVIRGIKGAITGGTKVKSKNKALVFASAGLGALKGIFNWQGKQYTHHGDVCQIIGVNDSTKMIMPFSSHNIRQKLFIEHQANQQQIELLRQEVGNEFSQRTGIATLSQGLPKKTPPTMKESIAYEKKVKRLEELVKRNRAIENHYDRVDKANRIAASSFSIKHHSLDKYLANLNNITQHLWSFYRIENDSKKLSLQQCAEENLARFLTRFKKELQDHFDENEEKINALKKNRTVKNVTSTTMTLPADYALDQSIYQLSEVNKSLQADIAEIEKIEKKPIENHFIYAIRAEDKDAVAQLDLLIGKKPTFI